MDEAQLKTLIETVLDLYADFRAGKPGGSPPLAGSPTLKAVRETLAELLARIHPEKTLEIHFASGPGMGQVMEYMKAFKGVPDAVTPGSAPAAPPADAATGKADPAPPPEEVPFHRSILL